MSSEEPKLVEPLSFDESLVRLAAAPNFDVCRPVKLPDGTLSPIKAHAKIGVRALLANPHFALFDEMGAMKSAQSIIAAQFLFLDRVIDRVVVIAPAAVVDVWYDDELGELKKHLFIPAIIERYHAKTREWQHSYGDLTDTPLPWCITNYEFIRREERLEKLLKWVNKKTLLILDESSAIKSYRSAQTKACFELRAKAGRVILLNGTPIANTPIDLFSQGNLMSKDILECRGITHFRARYCQMGGYVVHTPWGARPTQVIGWQNLEDLQRRFAPHVLRRLTRQCVDLPPELPAVTLTVELSKETWKVYKEMRDEMVAWLNQQTVSVAQQTITKVMRLSQITSGFLGGLEPEVYGAPEDRPLWLDKMDEDIDDLVPSTEMQIIGREKLDFVLEWAAEKLEEDPNLKLLVWGRFVPEVKRFLEEYGQRFPHVQLGAVAGQPLLGKKRRAERHEALRLLNPQTAPQGPVTVGGTYGTGSLGLNFTACHTVMNMSFDYSYWKFEQSLKRTDRPGQVHPVSNFNLVAVGPNGQKTIDHKIVAARINKEDIAKWTTSAWVHALTTE